MEVKTDIIKKEKAPPDFSRRAKHRRTQAWLSPSHLAKFAGVTSGAVSQWESGTSRPSKRDTDHQKRETQCPEFLMTLTRISYPPLTYPARASPVQDGMNEHGK